MGFYDFCTNIGPTSIPYPPVSDVCFIKPAGATSLDITYTPVHPRAQIGCFDIGDKIMVYGGNGSVNSQDLLIAPTFLQPFNIHWNFGEPTTDWAPCA